MDSVRFAEIVDLQMRICKDVLVDKAREYATEDRLHNFKIAAELQKVDMLESVAGMMAKHTVSIYDMCGSEETFTAAQWDEKITDHINYLILLRAVVYEIEAGDTELAEPIPEPWIELNEVLQKIFGPINSRKGLSNA